MAHSRFLRFETIIADTESDSSSSDDISTAGGVSPPESSSTADIIKQLNNEKRLRKKAEDELQQLSNEKKLREKAEDELRQLGDKLKTVQAKWRRTTSQLDKVLAQTQGFKQVLDEELKSMAQQLRYNIHTFAIQYFSEPPSPDQFRLKRGRYGFIFLEDYKIYLDYPDELCPFLIQKFLWKFLVCAVFGRFRWAGVSQADFDGLWKRLTIRAGDEYQTVPRTTQTFHKWRATTTEIILQHSTEKDATFNANTMKRITGEVHSILRSLTERDYDVEFDNILAAAIKMDQTICSQVANVFWDFDISDDDLDIDMQASSDRVYSTVVSPAMIKQGKSNGEDFETKSVLLDRKCVSMREL